MKIIPSAVEAMRTAIATLDTAEVREAYRTGNYPRAELTRDVNRRYRWDLLHAACDQELLPRWFVTDTLYGECGANDSHIDTALRAVVAPL